MLALQEMPKQQREQEECLMQNILQFLLMEDTQLIQEKDEKYGRTPKKGWWKLLLLLMISNKGV